MFYSLKQSSSVLMSNIQNRDLQHSLSFRCLSLCFLLKRRHSHSAFVLHTNWIQSIFHSVLFWSSWRRTSIKLVLHACQSFRKTCIRPGAFCKHWIHLELNEAVVLCVLCNTFWFISAQFCGVFFLHVCKKGFKCDECIYILTQNI